MHVAQRLGRRSGPGPTRGLCAAGGRGARAALRDAAPGAGSGALAAGAGSTRALAAARCARTLAAGACGATALAAPLPRTLAATTCAAALPAARAAALPTATRPRTSRASGSLRSPCASAPSV
ncbi:hypothetical protein CCE01nite_29500 [Cellulomonas cellasea]|uniref:Uncharacterized protein n=1 Tax=Cellulomonas cellasea TaxID=43670 RepID=A0A4Y3KWZ7_9CELL|nr:hypothetical protein CCE01nite_29500 [Cellulomonas cellasea]